MRWRDIRGRLARLEQSNPPTLPDGQALWFDLLIGVRPPDLTMLTAEERAELGRWMSENLPHPIDPNPDVVRLAMIDLRELPPDVPGGGSPHS